MSELARWPVPAHAAVIHLDAGVRRRLDAFAVHAGMQLTAAVMHLVRAAADAGMMPGLSDIAPEDIEQLRRRPSPHRRRRRPGTVPLVIFGAGEVSELYGHTRAVGAITVDQLVERVLDMTLPPYRR